MSARNQLLAVLAICASVAMATLDTAIVNTALPTIATFLSVGEADAVWVINAYQLAMIAALLPLAALGERAGLKRIYVIGLALFTITSLGCGVAYSLPSLIAARALQGLGAAMVMSVNTALVRFLYPPERLGRGVGLNALVVGLSFTAGPSVASAVLALGPWQWLFLINVPVGLIALIMCLRFLPATPRSSHRFDPVAAMLCAGFLALLVFGGGEAAHGGIGWTVWAVLAGAGLCLALLVRRQAGQPAPILPLDLFRNRLFTLSATTAVCAFCTQSLAFVSLPFLLQGALGRSQVATGALITPWPAVVAVLAPIAGSLSDRYPPGLLAGIGLGGMSLGMAAFATIGSHTSDTSLVLFMLLCGAGFGCFQSPNLRAIMTSAPAWRSGGASGIVALARLFGQTLGAALVAACITFSARTGPYLACWLGCAFAGAGCVASLARLAGQRPDGQGHRSARMRTAAISPQDVE